MSHSDVAPDLLQPILNRNQIQEHIHICYSCRREFVVEIEIDHLSCGTCDTEYCGRCADSWTDECPRCVLIVADLPFHLSVADMRRNMAYA